MYELIDENNNIKMMALIICSFIYGNNLYCLYSIKRNSEEDNIFVSKLVKNSLGYTMDSNLQTDEKEAIENIITSFLSKSSLITLKEQGFELTKIELKGINKFNEKKCYITTYKRTLIKDCMLNYNLEIPNSNSPIIERKKSKPINKGNIGSILLIILGITTIIICLIVIFKVLL